MEVDESFDPEPFKLLDKFTKRELDSLLKAHRWLIKNNKPDALKAAKELLNSTQGRVASVTLLEIQRTKCQIDTSNDNDIAQMAARLTRELDLDTLTAEYDDQGPMKAPLPSGKHIFDKAFLVACNGKLDAVSSGRFVQTDGNRLKKSDVKNVPAVKEKKKLRNDHSMQNACCLLCFIVYSDVHFPDHKTNAEVKRRLQIAIEAVKRSFFESQELHEVYDKFNDEDRASFNARYKIVASESKQVDKLTDVLSKFYLSVRANAEQLNNMELLKACGRLRDEVFPKLKIQIENTDDTVAVDV